MTTFKLFVYGTLMSDGSANHLLAGATKLRDVTTMPEYQLIDCGYYPGLVHVGGRDGKAIQGELWEVNESKLPDLDRLEGVPTLYQRGLVEIEGEGEPVVTYFYQRHHADSVVYDGARWDNDRTVYNEPEDDEPEDDDEFNDDDSDGDDSDGDDGFDAPSPRQDDDDDGHHPEDDDIDGGRFDFLDADEDVDDDDDEQPFDDEDRLHLD